MLAASTPWGYLQVHADKTLSDMSLFRFLRDHMGIMMTPDTLFLGVDELDVKDNRAKHSHFDTAFAKVLANPHKLAKYTNTLQSAIAPLSLEGLLTCDRITQIKNAMLNSSSSSSSDDTCETTTSAPTLNYVPDKKNPVCRPGEIDACLLLGKCLPFNQEGEKAPGIAGFPGDFAADQQPALESRQITVTTAYRERVSTGLYLPAGVQLQLTVNEGDVSGWMLRIGAHTDDLSHCDKLTRWPSVTVMRKLCTTMCVCSPFGGLVFLESPASGGSLKLTLSNVCEAPFVDVQQSESVDDWMRRRDAPGLWAELAGRNIIFTTPSECVRHLSAVEVLAVLDFWDRIWDIHHELRGTSAATQRRERVVNDIQAAAGYMHAGYPIVTHLDCCQRESPSCLFDIEKLTKPAKSTDGDNCLFWGMKHYFVFFNSS